ncbi:MAG: flagellar hook-basal body protein, partial [Bacillus sp. (in: firmicutes)]
QKQMDIISNNISNVGTNGYKRREATFTDLLVQEFNNQERANKEVNRLTPNGIRQGTGAKLGQVQLVMTQGALKQTDRSLDTAFTKEGQLFKVLVQTNGVNEVQYTRNGALYLSPLSDTEVMLVNGDGLPVLDENNNPITINGEAKDYSIDANGQLTVTKTAGATEVFNLGVVRVNKPQFLEQRGGNLLGLPANVAQDEVLTELTGGLRGEISLQQGALEQSNVDLSKEMTELINVQRAYQFQSRSVTLADQMMGLVNGIR